MKSDNKYGLVFQLKDKFGAHGIISFVILEIISSDQVFIDNWAMSCRVLERGMENFIINHIQDFCISKEINQIISEYIRTPKNSLVKDLYLKLKFDNYKDKYLLKVTSENRLETKIKLYHGKK